MWTRSDWRELSLSQRPSLKSFTIFLVLVFLVISYYSSDLLFLCTALIFGVCYFTFRRPLIVLNEVWFRVGLAVSWCLQPILLLLIYFFIFTPFGFILKLASKETNDGHWIKKEKPSRFDRTF